MSDDEKKRLEEQIRREKERIEDAQRKQRQLEEELRRRTKGDIEKGGGGVDDHKK